MFADSLLESSWENRSHRGWTTFASFAVQLFGLGFLLFLPLLFTEGLPKLRLLSPAVPFSAPPAPVPPSLTVSHHNPQTSTAIDVAREQPFVSPPSIPTSITPDAGTHTNSTVDVRGVWTPGINSDANRRNGVMSGLGGEASLIPPPSPVRNSRRPTSVMMQGNLIDRIEPVYPPIARAVRIQGTVILRAIISRGGAIENLQVVSGHPMLIKAAMDAVKQWRYRPYVLNGQPVEVETQVTVNFVLAGG